ncbi:hypothetical protein Y032_0128g1434 [Ancylostoma ceylanicum]|uniref:Uncharacterized protein n=1 Tax=Ancylostoma ceylanicum TaxID=53326 RepID=A0A016T7S5_9BILA|nr:hypothetical protein Y032_0128g1434 [Ancylostoma ceylanicum]
MENGVSTPTVHFSLKQGISAVKVHSSRSDHLFGPARRSDENENGDSDEMCRYADDQSATLYDEYCGPRPVKFSVCIHLIVST